MNADRLAVLREQLHVTWSLAEHTLADLRDDECQWLRSPDSWTVHRDAAGRWVADWAEPEPDDVAAPSLAWVLWHAICWWSILLDRCTGTGTLTRQEVLWPGAENSLGTLRSLHDRWQRFLDSLDSDDLDSGEHQRPGGLGHMPRGESHRRHCTQAATCLHSRSFVMMSPVRARLDRVELADTLAGPPSVEPGEVSDVSPAVASHRDREDVTGIALR